MKIRMLTGLSGPDYNLAPSDERDFPEAEGLRLIKAGFAVLVTPEEREAATKDAVAEKRGKA